MAEKQDLPITGTFRGYADGNSVQIGWSKDKTSQQIMAMVVLDDGRRYQWQGNLTDQTGRDITRQSLLTMGWDGKSRIGTKEGDLAGFGGVRALFTVEMHSYNGKSYPRISRVDSLNGAAPRGGYLNDAEIDKLNDLIFREMRAVAPPKQVQPAQRQAAAQQAPAPHNPPPVGPEPARNLMGAIMTDEQRLAAIDRGDDAPERPEQPEEDLPF